VSMLTSSITNADYDDRTGRFYHGLGNVKFGQDREQEGFEYLEKAREYVTRK